MRALGTILSSVCAAVACASVPLPNDALEAQRVRQVVDAMQSAIDRQDPGAYMAMIDPSDSVLITEHRAWFADLDVSPVDDLRVELDTQTQVVLDDDGSVIAPLVFSWHVPSEDKPRRYELLARFAPIGSAKGQWHFTGRAWEVALLDTPGVRVYCDEAHREIAELAIERVPEIRDRVAEDMGIDPNGGDLHEVVVKIYPKMRELQASIYPSYTAGISGWNEPGESIKILGRNEMGQDRLDPLLAHEIGHAVSFEYGPVINDAPWWSLEGVAEVAAGLFWDSWERKNKRIVRLAGEDNLRRWQQLADFKGEAVNHAMHVYLQGWSMIDYIDRTFGKDTRNAWFTRLGHGDTLDEASHTAMGISFEHLNDEWHKSLIEQVPDEDDQGDSGS
ncbi:MAG: peptidase MA family metallohydrolase [Phycisphaerales bacterium JB047]